MAGPQRRYTVNPDGTFRLKNPPKDSQNSDTGDNSDIDYLQHSDLPGTFAPIPKEIQDAFDENDRRLRAEAKGKAKVKAEPEPVAGPHTQPAVHGDDRQRPASTGQGVDRGEGSSRAAGDAAKKTVIKLRLTSSASSVPAGSGFGAYKSYIDANHIAGTTTPRATRGVKKEYTPASAILPPQTSGPVQSSRPTAPLPTVNTPLFNPFWNDVVRQPSATSLPVPFSPSDPAALMARAQRRSNAPPVWLGPARGRPQYSDGLVDPRLLVPQLPLTQLARPRVAPLLSVATPHPSSPARGRPQVSDDLPKSRLLAPKPPMPQVVRPPVAALPQVATPRARSPALAREKTPAGYPAPEPTPTLEPLDLEMGEAQAEGQAHRDAPISHGQCDDDDVEMSAAPALETTNETEATATSSPETVATTKTAMQIEVTIPEMAMEEAPVAQEAAPQSPLLLCEEADLEVVALTARFENLGMRDETSANIRQGHAAAGMTSRNKRNPSPSESDNINPAGGAGNLVANSVTQSLSSLAAQSSLSTNIPPSSSSSSTTSTSASTSNAAATTTITTSTNNNNSSSSNHNNNNMGRTPASEAARKARKAEAKAATAAAAAAAAAAAMPSIQEEDSAAAATATSVSPVAAAPVDASLSAATILPPSPSSSTATVTDLASSSEAGGSSTAAASTVFAPPTEPRAIRERRIARCGNISGKSAEQFTKDRIEALEKANAAKAVQIGELMAAKEGLENEVQGIREEWEGSKASAGNSVAKAKLDAIKHKQAKEETENDYKELEKSFDSLETRFERVTKHNKDLVTEVQRLTKTAADHDKILQAQKDQHTSELNALKTESNKLKAQEAELNNRLKAQEAEYNSKLKAQEAGYNNKLKARVAEQRSSPSTAEAEYNSKLDAFKTEQYKKLKTLETEFKRRVDAEKAENVAKTNDHDAKCRDMEKQLAEYKTELEAEKNKKSSQPDDATAAAQIKELEESKQQLEKANADMKAKLKKYGDQLILEKNGHDSYRRQATHWRGRAQERELEAKIYKTTIADSENRLVDEMQLLKTADLELHDLTRTNIAMQQKGWARVDEKIASKIDDQLKTSIEARFADELDAKIDEKIADMVNNKTKADKIKADETTASETKADEANTNEASTNEANTTEANTNEVNTAEPVGQVVTILTHPLHTTPPPRSTWHLTLFLLLILLWLVWRLFLSDHLLKVGLVTYLPEPFVWWIESTFDMNTERLY